MSTDYNKFNKLAKTIDLEEGEEKNTFYWGMRVAAQPPFQKPIEWYADTKNGVPGDTIHHLYWQMKDAGWEQDVIDYKLSQAVHYSAQAIHFRELEKKSIAKKLQECSEHSQSSKIEQDNIESSRIQNSMVDVLVGDYQHSRLIEQNLHPEHSSQLRLRMEEQADLALKSSVKPVLVEEEDYKNP